jgi:hypothetical protein
MRKEVLPKKKLYGKACKLLFTGSKHLKVYPTSAHLKKFFKKLYLNTLATLKTNYIIFKGIFSRKKILNLQRKLFVEMKISNLINIIG